MPFDERSAHWTFFFFNYSYFLLVSKARLKTEKRKDSGLAWWSWSSSRCCRLLPLYTIMLTRLSSLSSRCLCMYGIHCATCCMLCMHTQPSVDRVGFHIVCRCVCFKAFIILMFFRFVGTADANSLPCHIAAWKQPESSLTLLSMWRAHAVGFFLFLWISYVRGHCLFELEWNTR